MRCQVQLFFFFHPLFKASRFKLPLAIWVLFCSCENTAANATVGRGGSFWEETGPQSQTDKRLGLKRSGCSLKWTAEMESVRRGRNSFSKSKSWKAIMGWINTKKSSLLSRFFLFPPSFVCRQPKHHREGERERTKAKQREKGTNYCNKWWSFPLTSPSDDNNKQTTYLRI